MLFKKVVVEHVLQDKVSENILAVFSWTIYTNPGSGKGPIHKMRTKFKYLKLART
jgi:hypothetical protein